MQPAIALCLVMVGVSVVSFITIAGVALIALGSSGVFTPSNSVAVTTTTTATTTVTTTTTLSPVDQLSLAMSDISLYPSKSYLAALSSFSKASSSYSLLPLNQSLLSLFGNSDNTSSVLEAGRAQYLFYTVPAPPARRKRASSDVITAIALHFGVASSTDTLAVIPIPGPNDTNTTNPGVVNAFLLPDGSRIVRVVLSIPTAICSKVNGKPIDACITIIYQAYAIVNNNSIAPLLALEINAACGDICNLTTSACSATCTKCDGQQVAGYDTPVTRRYNMGTNAATFLFTYQTYVIKDRIKVWNSGSLIYDTGCVGANATANVTYSSTSQSIRVDVEPNCDCAYARGCGTAWYFIVGCLNLTSSRRQIMDLPNLELERQLIRY